MTIRSPRITPVAAIIRRDFSITSSYRIAFFLDLTLGMLSVVIYFFVSRTFGGSVGRGLGSAPDYFSFAAVGAIITLVVQAASVGLTRRLRDEQLTGTLEILTTEPVTPTEISLGLAGFPFLFAATRATLYLGISALILGLDLSRADWLGFLLMLLLTGLTMSVLGVLVGALVLVMNRGEAIAPLITLALGFFGGAFFPVAVLPAWAEPLASAVPTRFIFDGMRDAIFAGGGWAGEALALTPQVLVGLPLAIAIFSFALNRARAKGTLSQY